MICFDFFISCLYLPKSNLISFACFNSCFLIFIILSFRCFYYWENSGTDYRLVLRGLNFEIGRVRPDGVMLPVGLRGFRKSKVCWGSTIRICTILRVFRLVIEDEGLALSLTLHEIVSEPGVTSMIVTDFLNDFQSIWCYSWSIGTGSRLLFLSTLVSLIGIAGTEFDWSLGNDIRSVSGNSVGVHRPLLSIWSKGKLVNDFLKVSAFTSLSVFVLISFSRGSKSWLNLLSYCFIMAS